MRVKRSIEEIRKADYCNFVELCELLNVSRSTLTKQQNKYDLFPSVVPDGGEAKVYPVTVCIKIYKMFTDRITDGFKASAAAMRVKESKAYQKLIDRV